MPEITMPRLSDTMQEGTLAKWLKRPGDRIEKGEVIAQIETDKATMDLEAYDEGVLQNILVQEGQTVPIGQPVATVETAAPTEMAAPAAPVERRAEERAEARPAPRPVPEQPTEERRPPRPPEAERAEVKASPMARAIAREHGIDLRTLEGRGPGGRIVRADVQAAVERLRARPEERVAPRAEIPAPREAVAPPPPPPRDGVEEIPLSAMRRIVARRMVESVQSAPHFYLTTLVDAEALVQFRAQLNEHLASSTEETKVSLNDLLVKACATALKAHPDVNVSFQGDKLLRYRFVNVGIAVAVKGGLLVPVIRDADQKTVSQIAREAKVLIDKARAGKLSPDEYTGGTFTISNLGMYGVDHFTAVINPPEAAILAVGAVAAEPVARDGQVVVRQRMKMTLSIDHRALDGATAATFLRDLKAMLENPLRIVV